MTSKVIYQVSKVFASSHWCGSGIHCFDPLYNVASSLSPKSTQTTNCDRSWGSFGSTGADNSADVMHCFNTVMWCLAYSPRASYQLLVQSHSWAWLSVCLFATEVWDTTYWEGGSPWERPNHLTSPRLLSPLLPCSVPLFFPQLHLSSPSWSSIVYRH